MKKTAYFLVLSMVVLMTGCGAAKKAPQSYITGGDYDASKNVTEYFVYPLGQVSLPGKWEKGDYNNSSRQQSFLNQDEVLVAVSFAPCDKYEFNPDGALRGYEFAEAFYEWDSKYLVSTFGLDRKVLEKNKANNYIIYRIFGKDLDTYFLVGEKNGNVSNFSVSSADKWTEQQKVDFLKSLFKD